MPKFLLHGSYTTEGTKGLVREGGVARRATVEKLVQSLGGKVEAFYFAFGETDAYAIIDVPDIETAAALSFAVNQSGAVGLRTTLLLTPEETDRAIKKKIDYRAPGQ